MGLYPYAWGFPENQLINAAKFSPQNILSFLKAGIAYSQEPPEWLIRAINDGKIDIELEVKAGEPLNPGKGRIFTLSEDIQHKNIAVDQKGENLIIRLQTAAKTLDGSSSHTVRKFFRNRAG